MNKPVAYIDHISGKPKLIDAYVVQTDYDIPLYIHPVKELTDEEIDNIYSDIFGYKPIDNSAVYFAKSILKKAQEK